MIITAKHRSCLCTYQVACTPKPSCFKQILYTCANPTNQPFIRAKMSCLLSTLVHFSFIISLHTCAKWPAAIAAAPPELLKGRADCEPLFTSATITLLLLSYFCFYSCYCAANNKGTMIHTTYTTQTEHLLCQLKFVRFRTGRISVSSVHSLLTMEETR